MLPVVVRRVTQQDIADAAGVTRATVSYVLNGRARQLGITEPVIARIETAAERLHYRPNRVALALNSGKTRVLGLDIRSRSASFWSVVAESVQEEALERGYDVLLTGDDEIDYLEQGRIDALVILAAEITEQRLARWRAAPVPPVVLMADLPPADLPSVRLAVEPGLRSAVERLAALGHRTIAWWGPREEVEPADQPRARIVKKLAAGLGMTCQVVHPETSPAQEGTMAQWRFQQELSARFAACTAAHGAVSAWLCWNDAWAIAAWNALVASGRRVPEDVAVIGFDDHLARTWDRPLASISQAWEETGRVAARLALAIAGGTLPYDEARRTVERVAARFVDRPSIAPAPGR